MTNTASKLLVYLDQSALGPLALGEPLAGWTGVQWVFSNEHFSEIRRSSNPHQYLAALDKLGAKLIELELIDWQITGSARLIDGPDAGKHYSAYCEALTDVDVDENLFDPFQAWVNGGGAEQLLRDFPDHVAEQILSLTESLPVDQRSELRDAASQVDFVPMIEQMVARGNDINKTRETLGGGKGRIGQIAGRNELVQIWDLIGPACDGITCDQFFGFDPPDKQGYESWPTYLGIVGCCAILDIIGFQAEKKCRKIDKIPNVRSDAAHIAMGHFCSAIVSADRRLARRAKAIYEYKGIGTASLLLQNAVY